MNLTLSVDEALVERARESARQREYFVTVPRKLGLTPGQAKLRVQNLARLDVVVIRPELIVGAIELHRDHSLSFWDALIVKAALAGGCTRLVTEDLDDGQRIEGLTVSHPF